MVNQGTAEVAGIELALNREYSFSGCKRAVFSWHGCEIWTSGNAEAMYQTARGETTAAAALRVHAFLESRRERCARLAAAEVVGGVFGDSSPLGVGPPSVSTPLLTRLAQHVAGESRGPRVLVCGPADSGKSTLCGILVAYAARAGREPIFVDLDPGLGDAGAPPGALGAAMVNLESLSVEEGLRSPEVAPLSVWFGYEALADNVELYSHVVDRLALAVADRLSSDRSTRSAGVVVNTSGCVDAAGLSALKHACAVFNIDVVLVLAHDRLYQELRAASADDVVVANLPRSRGVVDRGPAHRRRARHRRIHEYFYGVASPTDDLRLAPNSLELRFRDCKIFKVLARDAAAVDSMLPVGQGSMLAPLQVVAVPPSTSLVHNFLVACHQPRDAAANGSLVDHDPAATHTTDAANPYQFLLDCSAAGFVVVTNVNQDRGTLTLLTPCSGDLPTQHLLLGKIEFMEGPTSAG